jgi:hypothetical protein
MNLTKLLSELDAEIARLEQARNLLANGSPRRGRPPAIATVAATPAKKKRRKLTPEGRARIAEAVKRRWERQKKAAASNGK